MREWIKKNKEGKGCYWEEMRYDVGMKELRCVGMNSFVRNIYEWMYSLCCTSRDSTTEEGRDKKLQFVCFIDDWGCLLELLVKRCG